MAIDGTHTNIKLTGLVAGSRVQLYDQELDTELYNEIVAGTSLTLPIIWTADKMIRVRAMYVNGTTAKQWYEVTDNTLSNTGLTLNVNQEDDDIYNDIAIDGSTVTECSITGTVLTIEVNDADNSTSPQRIYAFEVAWLFTESGMRDQSLYINAITDTVFEVRGGLKIKNMKSVGLNINGGNMYPTTGEATDLEDTSGGSIFLNSKVTVGFPYVQNPQSPDILLAYGMGVDE